MSEDEILSAIDQHQARNASLRADLLGIQIDLRKPRPIEVHSWGRTEEKAIALADFLRFNGVQIRVLRKAASADDALPWNIEAEVVQSVVLTTRREFTEELVRWAAFCGCSYDGWGTRI